MKKFENKGRFSYHYIQTVHLIPGKEQRIHGDDTSGGAGLCDFSLVFSRKLTGVLRRPVFTSVREMVVRDAWLQNPACFHHKRPGKLAHTENVFFKSPLLKTGSYTFEWPLPLILGLFRGMRSSSGCTFTFDFSAVALIPVRANSRTPIRERLFPLDSNL